VSENVADLLLLLFLTATIAVIVIPFQLARIARALEHAAGISRPRPPPAPARIDVQSAGNGVFHVIVSEGQSLTTHEVTVGADDASRLARPGETPEDLVRRCFEFLLARGPKELILPSFDVRVVSEQFPEFEGEITGG
jgi:hypothetical protein